MDIRGEGSNEYCTAGYERGNKNLQVGKRNRPLLSDVSVNRR
jgi:hypothetical protein